MENKDKHPADDCSNDIEMTFVEGSDRTPSASSSTPPKTDGKHPTGGEKIGNGTVSKMIGRGGMARIYLTWCDKLEINRVVKILQPEINDSCLQRFETEARITAKLHHSNIVEIHSVDEWNGLAFIEMEYLDGDDLKKRIKRNGRLPFEVCSAIGVLICRALEYAHSQDFKLYNKRYHGIIHRDLKPENVMVTRSGQVKLMDFGIARPMETSLHTVEGNITGTLPYLSPEQMEGCDIDGRTDVYSFGAILFEILTGDRAFPQEDVTSLVNAKARGQYTDISQYNIGIPKSLCTIVRRCLQTQPSRRYKDASELLAALEKAHAELSSVSPEKAVALYVNDPNGAAGSTSKGGRFVSGKILPAAGLGLGVLTLIAAVIVFITNRDLPSEDGDTPSAVIIQAVPEQETVVTNEELARASDEQKREVISAPPKETAKKPSAKKEIPQRPPRPAKKPHSDAAPTVSSVEDALAEGNLVKVAGDLAKLKLENKTEIALAIRALEATANVLSKEKTLRLYEDVTCHDGGFLLKKGLIMMQAGSVDDAIASYKKSLATPSVVLSPLQLRKEAFYRLARAYSRYYEQKKDDSYLRQAQAAWRMVEKLYSDNPGHPYRAEAETYLNQAW